MAMIMIDKRVQEFVPTPLRMVIDGSLVDAEPGWTSDTRNPATDAAPATVAKGNAADIDVP